MPDLARFAILLKKHWPLLTGAIGAITTVSQFVLFWDEHWRLASIVTAVLGFVVLVGGVAYVAFAKVASPLTLGSSNSTPTMRYSRHFRLARVGLVAVSVLVVAFAVYMYAKDKELQSQFVVAVARFRGPDEVK